MSLSQIRRVKTIFSVIASPSRLEILKILNSKGSMSYSELKQQAGFRSKKESGKFAYHLRKLLKQNLIVQNKAERKYMLTSLGRLVLTAAKQIEEQALIESGRLYVRTSSQKMEEFDPSKITQSLVKEAGVPLEIAQRIASEAESRIYKFQASFLTAPLIRELVNSILIEQGQEHYWRMLTRVGMPVYDVKEILEKVGTSQKSQEDVIYYTAGKVFSEYLIQSRLPPDVADAHLNGEMHIPWISSWELKPEVVIVDMEAFSDFDLGLKLPNLPRDGLRFIYRLVYALSREVSNEIYLRNALGFLGDKEEFLSFLRTLSLSLPGYYESPRITLELDYIDERMMDAFLNFSNETPIPKISLAIPKKREGIKQVIESVNPVLLASETKVTLGGLFYDERKPLNVILYGVSINLPRIAMDSHGDEVYFRAKIAMFLDTIINALTYRVKAINSHIKGGLLPGIRALLEREPIDYIRTIINMTGLDEAVSLLQPSSKERLDYKKKAIDTTKEQIIERFDGPAFISLIPDDGSKRLANLDLEKRGKGRIKSVFKEGYSQGYKITANTPKEIISEITQLIHSLDGGIYVEVWTDAGGLASITPKVESLPYYKLMARVGICAKCGWASPIHIKKCKRCGGTLMPTR